MNSEGRLAFLKKFVALEMKLELHFCCWLFSNRIFIILPRYPVLVKYPFLSSKGTIIGTNLFRERKSRSCFFCFFLIKRNSFNFVIAWCFISSTSFLSLTILIKKKKNNNCFSVENWSLLFVPSSIFAKCCGNKHLLYYESRELDFQRFFYK